MTIRSETTTRREKKCLGVRRIVYEFETRHMRDVRTKNAEDVIFRRNLFAGDVSFWTLFRRKWRRILEQSHDEVYGCLKGGSGNSGGKRLAISMVEEAWLSENEEV
ncbi:hypothetical protein Tco_0312622 [Tanacetum coccineum]